MAKEASGRENGSPARDTGGNAAGASGGSVLGGVFIFAVSNALLLASKLWKTLTDGGHLAAFGRQGADELGEALKAFPESISVQEPGAILNPTQGEIAAARKPAFRSSYYSSYSASSIPPRPWPSDIARQNQAGSGRDSGNDLGKDTGASL